VTGRTAAVNARPRARSGRNETALGVGLALGAAGLAVASHYLVRRAQRTAHLGLVDWRRVEQLAARRLKAAPGALSAAELGAAEADYARAMAQVVPLLETRLGLPLPGVVERHALSGDGGACARPPNVLRARDGRMRRVVDASRLLLPGA